MKDLSLTQLILFFISQIPFCIGIIFYFYQKKYEFKFRKKEINFTKIQENKILEIKIFYKSYLKVLSAITSYLNEYEYGECSEKNFNIIRETIRESLMEFEIQSKIVGLYLSSEDLETINKISNLFYTSRMSIAKVVRRRNRHITSDDDLNKVKNEILLKQLPNLMNKIESRLRLSFELS